MPTAVIWAWQHPSRHTPAQHACSVLPEIAHCVCRLQLSFALKQALNLSILLYDQTATTCVAGLAAATTAIATAAMPMPLLPPAYTFHAANVWHSFASMFSYMLAMFDYNVFYNSTNPTAAMLLFIAFEFVMNVLMLNVLIASMTNSFSKLTQVSEGHTCGLGATTHPTRALCTGFSSKELLQDIDSLIFLPRVSPALSACPQKAFKQCLQRCFVALVLLATPTYFPRLCAYAG